MAGGQDGAGREGHSADARQMETIPQERSFESLSSFTDNDEHGELSAFGDMTLSRGPQLEARDLRNDLQGSRWDTSHDSAGARLAATEQKVNGLLREFEMLKASGVMDRSGIAASTIGTAVGGTAGQVGRAIVVQGQAVTASTGGLKPLSASQVWLTPSGAAIAMSRTGAPMLQVGNVMTEESTQFPEPTPRGLTTAELLEQQHQAQEEAEKRRIEEEKARKPKRKAALTTTAWISFADDDPEERFDYCGEMISSDRHGVGVMTWRDGSSYTGQFVQNDFHGYAFERYADGSVYVGQYKDGFREGLGQFTQAGGSSYSGQWSKGHQHGVGIEVQTHGGLKGEYVSVFREGVRVEKYARTAKNSSRIATDLETVFAKTAAVVNQVKAVTLRVRQVAAGNDRADVDDVSEIDGSTSPRKVPTAQAKENQQREALDPAALAAARAAKESLAREKAKLAFEMQEMKLFLSKMEAPPTPPPNNDFTRAGSDPYLSDDILPADIFKHVQAKPFSHIPGLENVELSVPVPKGIAMASMASKHRRIENIQPDDDQSHYKGALKGGRPHGHGSFTDASTGDKYQGEWLDGLYHGQGTLTKRNGIVYQGDFFEGAKHGQGVLHWPSNPSALARYEGSFKADKKHGYGIEGGGDGTGGALPRKVKYENGCLVLEKKGDDANANASAHAHARTHKSKHGVHLEEIQIDPKASQQARNHLSRAMSLRRASKASKS